MLMLGLYLTLVLEIINKYVTRLQTTKIGKSENDQLVKDSNFYNIFFYQLK